MPLGVLMTDILPSLMAFDRQRLLLMMVCKGNFRLAEAMAPRLTPMGGCGVLTVDLTVILSLPIGQGIGRPAPIAKRIIVSFLFNPMRLRLKITILSKGQ